MAASTTLSDDDDNHADRSMNEAQEEDESCWVPLIQDETAGSTREGRAAQTNTLLLPTPSPSRPNNHRNDDDENRHLQVISARLDTRIRLKQSLVDHPLDRAWRLFFQHFLREIWQLDSPLRLGILLVAVGTILQVLTWTLAFRWLNTQTIVLLLVFGVSFYYLAPPNVEEQLQYLGRLLINPNRAFELADYADPEIMRRLFVGLLLVPTLLEARTFGFLSEAMADSGTLLNNVVVGLVLAAFLLYGFKIQQATPRQCIQQAIIGLYGFALFFSLRRVDLRRLPALMGPFFMATGTLLLSSRDEDMNWLSRALRHALRLTLRDVLASVGDSVREDEMLQLAMLRWIVDYWSYQPPASSSRPSNGQSSTSTNGTEIESRLSRSTSAIVPARRSQEVQRHRDLQWEELQPMLDMTTDQMVQEVPAATAMGHQDVGSSIPPSSFDPSSSSRPSQQSFAHSSHDGYQSNDSLRNLQSMLSALDVDGRARPAVMAYKHVVDSFPPSRSHAVLLSIIRRCPAMLMLLCRYIIGSDLALMSTATLLPFAIMEAFRVLHWAEACQRALESNRVPPLQSGNDSGRQSQSTFISVPAEMDPMCILLSGDGYTPTVPPPLLQVWMNISGSVHALEMGLTATRCVQTTVVAADFAANIISLAQFGMEVSQYGWLHGVTVMARELMHLHTSQSAENAKYASAAVNAMRNGSMVARNVQLLAEEGEGGNPVIDPVVGVLAAIVGRGWLWGKEEEAQQRQSTVASRTAEESTVTIEELSSDGAPSDPNESVPVEEGSPREDEAQESTAVSTSEQPAAESQMTVSPADVQSQTDEPKTLRPSNSHSRSLQGVTTDTESPIQDLSGLMELIADAFEQGLIVESEKNAFMETLLVAATEVNGKPSDDAVKQMERSLRELLEASHAAAAACDVQENETCPTPEESGTRQPRPASATSAEGSPIKEDGLESDEWNLTSHEPKEASRLECVDITTIDDEHSDVVAPVLHETSIGTPNLRPETNADGTQQVVDAPQQEENQGDEWAKWVGGSIAVLGAVAGGLALANATQQRDDNSNSRSNDATNQSTFNTEEHHHDEENSDEWVAVSHNENERQASKK